MLLPGSSGVVYGNTNSISQDYFLEEDISNPIVEVQQSNANEQDETDENGGTITIRDGGQIIVPAQALKAASRFSWNTVEMRLAGALSRYSPIDKPLRVEAKRKDNDLAVTQLDKAVTVRMAVPEIRNSDVRPAIRVLTSAGWDILESSYDSNSKEDLYQNNRTANNTSSSGWF